MHKKIVAFLLVLTMALSFDVSFAQAGQASGVTLLDWSWRREGDGVVVEASVRNDTGGITYIGFVVVGYNAINQAIEVKYSGSSYAYSGITWSSRVSLSTGSQIT